MVESLLPVITEAVILDGRPTWISARNGPIIEISGMELEKTCAGVENRGFIAMMRAWTSC